MDQKRLMIAIAISIAILLGFQLLAPHPQRTAPPTPVASEATPAAPAATPSAGGMPNGTSAADLAALRNAPRLKLLAPGVEGSVNLLGARIDDLVLRRYRETIAPNSPLVRLLEPQVDSQPYFVQFGWTAPDGVKARLPGNDTLWTASGNDLGDGRPVTLSWDNGEGLTFEIALAIDDNYMFTIQQRVRNATGAEVKLFPWSRIRRDYTPVVGGYYILHEGLIGVLGGTLRELSYASAKKDGEKTNGVGLEVTTEGGWAGITDKYWLTALVPNLKVPTVATFRHIADNGDRYQVDFVPKEPIAAPAGGVGELQQRLFAGAKVVQLLDHYEHEYDIKYFYLAVDFGLFWFLTRPIFFALDWLYHYLGNFGVAILVFTVFVKALFFPLANKSYRSMSKMKLLAPKMTALREQYKDDQSKLQGAMMQLYKAEKVNPASGCLPMLVQIPVFFSLYKVIFVTIEMRHAPFFGWIHDLSAVDPTNVFNLFGLLPFDPTTIAPMLHLGAWPLIMGFTMYFQQKLNPPPPDPVQAKVFQFMPIIFTFMLASFPAGLVIYWSWNNLLTIGQQWLIMRQTRLDKPAMAKV